MRPLGGGELILIGFLLVFFSFFSALLMTIRVIQPSFFLSFISYAASVIGLILGLIGAASYVHNRRGK
jgi:hypothetical protein